MTQNNELRQPSDNSEANTTKSTFNRRQFVGAGIATAAAFVLPRPAKANAVKLPWDIPSTMATSMTTGGFPQPDLIANGTPEDPALLNVVTDTINITGVNPRSEETRCYNGTIPGPTFKVSAGEKLNIELTNDLPPNDDCPGTLNKPRCFNTTNLHFHGFHVSPMSLDAEDNPVSGGDSAVLSSDDVLYDLEPREEIGEPATSHPYCVWLPSFHAPGTHWYHSHMHGSTAIQIVDGMAGALIVEEEGEDRIDVDEDVLWILQEVIGNDDTDVYKCVTTSQEFTVNGVSQPTLTMRPGELQRWRFINATATPRGFMTLQFEKKVNESYEPIQLSRIAVDGISFYGQSPESISEMKLSPANRADFLVQLEAGEYRVYKGTFASNLLPAAGSTSANQVLATVKVEGDPIPTDQQKVIPDLIPGTAPAYLQTITQIDNTRTISFDRSGQGCGGRPGQPLQRVFETDNQAYDPDADQKVAINTAEEWTLTNTTGSFHPFHIHVNPFRVVEIFDPNTMSTPQIITEDEQKWWDTFYIPANANSQDGYIKIRHRFWDYNGRYVFHCHILIHEDLGMMQNVLIEGEGTDPCQPCTGTTCSNET